MSDTRQVMVVRRDLAMPVGKIASQVAHGSLAFLTRDGWVNDSYTNIHTGNTLWETVISSTTIEWLENSYTKIVLGVDSEEELLAIHQKALDAGLVSHLVTDNGTTVFNGQLTNTVVAIGPDFQEKIDPITKHLKLL